MKVLIVEDFPEIQAGLALSLNEVGVKAIPATSLEEAEKLFEIHKHEIAAIALDGCVPGNTLNTLPLIHRFRRSFKGSMIAMSSNADYRLEMLSAGCDHICPKDRLVAKVCQVLGIDPPADLLF